MSIPDFGLCSSYSNCVAYERKLNKQHLFSNLVIYFATQYEYFGDPQFEKLWATVLSLLNVSILKLSSRIKNRIRQLYPRLHGDFVVSDIVRWSDDSITGLKTHDCTLWSIKKQDTFIFSITLANIDGFSWFFHYYIQEGTAEKELVKIFASP